MASAFGTIVLGAQLENQVVATLKGFLSLYLAETERQTGVTAGTYPRPRSWNVTVEPDTFPAEQIPSLMVVSSGIDGEPVRRGNGKYDVWFGVSVAVVVTTPNERSSRALASVYAAAIRACLLQNRKLAGIGAGMDWTGERIDGVSLNQRNRTLGMCQVDFRIQVREVVQENGPTLSLFDPPDPDQDTDIPDDPLAPLDDLGTVETVHIDLDEHPITEDLDD